MLRLDARRGETSFSSQAHPAEPRGREGRAGGARREHRRGRRAVRGRDGREPRRGRGGLDVLEPHGISIWWGAYLGMAEETLFHGPLATVAPRIAAARAELRARHGWIMDIYLLRKDRADVA